MAKVSVIIPIYNVQEYLPKCLDSLINQTLEDIEIIAVDDGSTDASAQILDEYAARDFRIKAFHIKNGGVSNARNFGLSKACGEYIGFVDSDDYVHPNIFLYLLKICTENDAQIAQCGYCSDENFENFENLQEPLKVYEGQDEIVEAFFDIKITNNVWAKLYRREVVSNIFFPTDLHFAEDFEFNAKCLLNATKLVSSNLMLYHYTTRETSETHKKINPDQLKGFRVYDYVKSQLKKDGKAMRTLQRREASESLRFLDSIIGHKEIEKSYSLDLANRIRVNKKTIWDNKYLSFGGKMRCSLVVCFPSLYIGLISFLKLMLGRK